MLTNLDHDRLWFNTLISPSHESPVVFVCRSFNELRRRRPSLLQVQGCQWKHVGTLLVADRMWLLYQKLLNKVTCASIDPGYVLSDISDDGRTACTVQHECHTSQEYQRFLPPVSERELCESMRQRVSAPVYNGCLA